MRVRTLICRPERIAPGKTVELIVGPSEAFTAKTIEALGDVDDVEIESLQAGDRTPKLTTKALADIGVKKITFTCAENENIVARLRNDGKEDRVSGLRFVGSVE